MDELNEFSDCGDSSSSRLSPIYSGSSEISPFFRNKVKSLSDDSDEEGKSSPTTSSSGNFSDESWNSKRNLKPNNGVIMPIEIQPLPSRKKKKSKSSKRKRSSAQNGGDESVALDKRKKISSIEDDSQINLPKIPKKKRSGIEKSDEIKTEEMPNDDRGDAPPSSISSISRKMMEKMGYKEGTGLGKHGQGRVEPVEASQQKGRRGLGLILNNVDLSSIEYDPSSEVYDIHEIVSWLENYSRIDLPIDAKSWLIVGDKKLILDNETHFCDSAILKNVLTCKSALDQLSGEEIRRARSRANPFEMIKKGPYLNRAAMKMVNMDFVFNFMFTNPVNHHQHSLVSSKELLYFADVCAGPGGFSEYVLSKKKWEAKGFGFTLTGKNDFQLENFYEGPSESFETFYGECGDGDVYKEENIRSLEKHVKENTDFRGVHFMMADGGFAVDGQENIQEILSKRIYLCQCLVALSIVRPNGHFVCKLFDLFTPFSAGIIYLMYRSFRMISIHKPNTSRPANSERYLICKWKHEDVDHVKDYMFIINKTFNDFGESSNCDVNEIVPLDIMKRDEEFYNYLRSSNDKLGLRQVNSLAKVLMYFKDESLVETRQLELKKACMNLWGIEIKARRPPTDMKPDAFCRTFFRNDFAIFRKKPKNILDDNIYDCLYTIHDFFAVIVASPNTATYFLGVAPKKCYMYDRATCRWISTSGYNLELSPNTLVYGEIVQELIGQSLGQRRINVLHIIDAHTLGGKDISGFSYPHRRMQCHLYAKALYRPSMFNVMPIRAKKIYELDKLKIVLDCMTDKIMKNTRPKLVVHVNSNPENNEFFIPQGLMFIKHTKEPYKQFISQKNNMKYYWAPGKDAKFDQDRPADSVMNFMESLDNSLYWIANSEENVPFNKQSFLLTLLSFIEDNKFTRRDAK